MLKSRKYTLSKSDTGGKTSSDTEPGIEITSYKKTDPDQDQSELNENKTKDIVEENEQIQSEQMNKGEEKLVDTDQDQQVLNENKNKDTMENNVKIQLEQTNEGNEKLPDSDQAHPGMNENKTKDIVEGNEKIQSEQINKGEQKLVDSDQDQQVFNENKTKDTVAENRKIQSEYMNESEEKRPNSVQDRPELNENKNKDIVKENAKTESEQINRDEVNLQVEQIRSELLNQLEYLVTFTDKIEVLKSTTEKINQIEIQDAKTEILKTIWFHTVSEIIKYTRIIKKSIEHYLTYAKDFPYPKGVDTFEKKKTELAVLKRKLDALPNFDHFVDNRKNILNKEIDEAVSMLEEKANFNEKVLDLLRQLDDLLKKLKESGGIKKIQCQNITDFKKILEKIPLSCHIRLLNKKTQVIQELDKFQKSTEDRLVEEVEQDVKETEICFDEKSIPEKKMKIFENEDENYLQSIKNNITYLKTSSEKNEKITNEKDNLETGIEKYLNILNKIEENVTESISLDDFRKALGETVSIKERVDDLPTESLKLDDHQLINEKIKGILLKLDKNLASLILNQKPTENILELGDNFKTSSPNEHEVPKNSVEFVELIKDKANKFEIYVSNFLGSVDSMDYYIIQENLMRLFEELDQINFGNNEEVKLKTLEAMSYIKKLLEDLNSNACEQENN